MLTLLLQTGMISNETWIGEGGFDDEEFRKELELIFKYHHENIINFLGHNDVDNEMIIVNEYGINDSLDGYLEDTNKRHNLTQVLLVKSQQTIKKSIEMWNSVCHSATIYANALMHAGTTVDTFLRENLDWLTQTGFNTMSGHLQQGRSLMAPYLPQIGDSPRSTNIEVVQHSACLGLGLAALGTADEDIYDEIKSVLYTESAVAGEASGISRENSYFQ
nr:26S proteasome non-ATPase regulatory subunit 1 homolog A-like [Tanacetum cinerariifolium]